MFNFTDAFHDTVIRKFIESYEKGIAPNPCAKFIREPLRAITPGQAAVLYDGDIVLGGGTIK